MKELQNIPNNIHLQKKLYEWQVVVQNKNWVNVWILIFHGVMFCLTLFAEILVLWTLKDKFYAFQGINILIYGMIYPMQAIVCYLVLKENLEAAQERWKTQFRQLTVTLRNEGFEVIEKDMITQQKQQKSYQPAQVETILYNIKKKKKRKGISPPHIRFSIHTKEKLVEDWGIFLEEEQTKFLAVLLRKLYLKKKVQQLIPIEPPAPEEGEDLSQHLIEK